MNNIEISELDNISLSTLSSLAESECNGTLSEVPRNTTIAEQSPVIPNLNSGGPSVGALQIESSTDVTVGNQTYFQGTVIIKNLHTSDTNGNIPNQKNVDHTDVLDGWEKIWKHKKKRLLIVGVIFSLLLCGLIVLIVVLTANNPESPIVDTTTTTTTSSPATSSSSTETTTEVTTLEPTTTFRPLRIEQRADWSKHPAWSPNIDNMTHPVKELFLTDTGQRFSHWSCNDYTECLLQVRDIENRSTSYPFGDLSYNFMIPNMENIFEGRGWRYDGALLKDRGGDEVLFIAMMGIYTQMTPTSLQFDLLWSLMNEGIQSGYVDPDYKIYVECQKIDIKSPGEAFLKEIQSWSRYSNFSDKWLLKDCYTPT